ncbi:MAG: SspB family protein [Alphaproteobacteria bacterium]
MAESVLRYDRLIDDALRGVLKRVLAETVENGLPGNHHFYITFRTAAPGVEIPDRLHARYPEDMTIVLQNQYWGLEVEDDLFRVTLSFDKLNERLTVPFEAVTMFADPSVQFGLQFQGSSAEGAPETDGARLARNVPKVGAGSVETKGVEARNIETGSIETGSAAPALDGHQDDGEAERGQVIALDSFRKK